MTEGKALALVYLGGAIAFLMGYAGLASLGAGNDAIVLLMLVVGAVGVQVLESVVHRYSKERRKRER